MTSFALSLLIGLKQNMESSHQIQCRLRLAPTTGASFRENDFLQNRRRERQKSFADTEFFPVGAVKDLRT